MKNVKTFNDIQKLYTDKLNEYIEIGYTVNLRTMSGTQGEMAKIDLTNGKKIVRIYVEEFADYEDTQTAGIRCIKLVVKSYEYDECYNKYRTLWNTKGDLVEEVKFYKITKNSDIKDSIFTSDIKFAREAYGKQLQRNAYKCRYSTLANINKDVVKNILIKKK